MDKWQHVKSFN